MASETSVMTMRRIPCRSILPSPVPAASSSQPELDRDFDEHVDRRAEPARRREAPLPDGVDRALVEPGAEALHDAHGADAAVAPDDDLEHDVAGEAAPARLLGVVGLDLVKDGRRA